MQCSLFHYIIRGSVFADFGIYIYVFIIVRRCENAAVFISLVHGLFNSGGADTNHCK